MTPLSSEKDNAGTRVTSSARSEDAAVMNTNDDAFESKIAAMDAGYFHDRFLSAMKIAYESQVLAGIGQGPIRRRQPVMNRGTYARVLLKDRIVTSFLNSDQAKRAATVQIISLGAGFDTFPFRLMDARRQQRGHVQLLRYVELDLEPVVRQKQALGQQFLCDGGLFSRVVRHGDGRVGMSGAVMVARDRGMDRDSSSDIQEPCTSSRYSLHSCDLRDTEALQTTLFSGGEEGGQLSAANDAVTVVISELSLVYMEASDSDAVIERLGQWLHGPRVFLNLEPVQGGDQFGRLMDCFVAARGSALLGMRRYPSMESQRERFRRLGWTACIAEDMGKLWNAVVSLTETARLQRIELLDEVEELNLLLAHYCVVIAADCSVDVGALVS